MYWVYIFTLNCLLIHQFMFDLLFRLNLASPKTEAQEFLTLPELLDLAVLLDLCGTSQP